MKNGGAIFQRRNISLRRLLTIGLTLLTVTAAFSAQPKTLTIRSLKVLAVIYRGAPDEQGRLTDQEVQATKNGFEYGRLFYYRNSQCRLNLDFNYLVADRSAPNHDGPTYDNITKDLRTRGIKDNEYDGIVCTGLNFRSNYGGFQEFGHTGCAFGGGGKGELYEWVPENDPNTFYRTSWIIVHEFQHALDSPICQEAGHPEMLSAHPYSDWTESYFKYGCHKAGTHWSWIAHTLTSFKDYLDVKGVTDSKIVTADADGDGFPDDDPRLPMDEKRFGSDPAKKDTDGDGLDDIHEFYADVYRGSNPRKTDTDGDGISDGKDRNPTVALVETVSYTDADPAIDGKLDASYKPFMIGMYTGNSPALEKARMSACWNEDALYLFVKTDKQCMLSMILDSSPEIGLWEGGDSYMIKAKPDGNVVFFDLNPAGPVPGAKAAWGPDGLEIKIPALIGQGFSSEINYGGTTKRHEDVTDGLRLIDGRWIGVNFHLIAGDEHALFTPNWALFETKLEKQPTDPSRPSLRHSKSLSKDKNPVVVVSGVSLKSEVVIINEAGKMLGKRIGSGEVILNGVKVGDDATTGKNVLRAKVGDRQSEPFTLIVDNKAFPPTLELSTDGKTMKIKGEPEARVDIIACNKYADLWNLGTVHSLTLDKGGNGEFSCESASSGFIGKYGVNKDWEHAIFYRVDPQIDFAFKDRSPDASIQNENFCARWEGYLDVTAIGEYTFYLKTDDGSRLWIDGRLVVDNWGHHGDEETKTGIAKLSVGMHVVRVDYYEEDGSASAKLEWAGPGIERTTKLPVKPLIIGPEQLTYGALQIDKAGNVSEVAK